MTQYAQQQNFTNQMINCKQPKVQSTQNILEWTTKRTLLDRVRLELKLSKENSNNEQLFLINSYDRESGQGLEVTVRKILQVEYLVQDMNQKYGGFIIPVLDLNNFFKRKQSMSEVILQIQQYLNDLAVNGHCNHDSKLYEFLFNQEVSFPNIERYDKVLSDAAVYSRRYLNAIFTRKESQEIQTDHQDFIQIYREFKEFANNFEEIKKIIVINTQQQELLQDIFATLSEARGGLTQGVPPVQFATHKMKRQIKKLGKVIFEAQEAYYRWEVLNETVKELQCNLLKGLHEDNAYYHEKARQLKKWSKTLALDLRQVIIIGEKLFHQFSCHLYTMKKQQTLFIHDTTQNPSQLSDKQATQKQSSTTQQPIFHEQPQNDKNR